MHLPLNFENAILKGIQGLPQESLKEIAEFTQEFTYSFMEDELTALNQQETQHLENEFDNYQHIYPHRAFA